jgi:hypothetical protein
MSEVQEEGRGSTAFLNDSESRFRETFEEKESPANSNDKNAQGKNAQGKNKDKPTTIFGWSWRLQPRAEPASGDDPEKAGTGATKERKLVLLGPLYAGCGAALAGCEYWLLSSREPSSSLGFRSRQIGGAANSPPFDCDFIPSSLIAIPFRSLYLPACLPALLAGISFVLSLFACLSGGRIVPFVRSPCAARQRSWCTRPKEDGRRAVCVLCHFSSSSSASLPELR